MDKIQGGVVWGSSRWLGKWWAHAWVEEGEPYDQLRSVAEAWNRLTEEELDLLVKRPEEVIEQQIWEQEIVRYEVLGGDKERIIGAIGQKEWREIYSDLWPLLIDLLVVEIEERDQKTAEWVRYQEFFRPSSRYTDKVAEFAKELLWDDFLAEDEVVAVYGSQIRFIGKKGLRRLINAIIWGGISGTFNFITTDIGKSTVLILKVYGIDLLVPIETINLLAAIAAGGLAGLSVWLVLAQDTWKKQRVWDEMSTEKKATYVMVDGMEKRDITPTHEMIENQYANLSVENVVYEMEREGILEDVTSREDKAKKWVLTNRWWHDPVPDRVSLDVAVSYIACRYSSGKSPDIVKISSIKKRVNGFKNELEDAIHELLLKPIGERKDGSKYFILRPGPNDGLIVETELFMFNPR